MIKIKKILITSFVGLFVISSSLVMQDKVVTKACENDNLTRITILGTSDVHGRFVPWEYASDTENKAGSLSQISTLVKNERKENPNTILVDAGDAIQDNFVETFNKGQEQPMVTGMNMMGYDVWEMGNHEFNFGLNTLKNVVGQFKGKALAGNLYNKDGTRFLDGYTIIEKNGVKIGIIGMDTPMIKKFEKPKKIEGIDFRDTVQETKKAIKELEGKVDAIIGVMHMGLDNENGIQNTGVRDIANACPELTAIIAGHMHQVVDNEIVNGVIITEPGKYGKALSKVDLDFIKENNKYVLKNKNSKIIPVANVQSDKELEQRLKPFHDKLRSDVNVEIGQLRGINMIEQDEIPGIPTLHIEETPIVDFFQEVGKHFSNADVIALSIDNDKAKLDVGPIKKKDIAYNYRYTGGEITVYEVTGKDLKKYMEWAAGYFNTLKPGDITPSFNPKRRASKYNTNDMFSDLCYKIDLTKPEGQRIKDVTYLNGNPVKDTDKIKLGMNSYRMDQLLGEDGIFEGKKFNKVWDSKKAFGEDEGTIRNLAINYIENVKKRDIEAKKKNNWCLLGIDRNSDNYKKVKELVKAGKIKVPSTKDGKYTNIASINLADIPKEFLNDDNASIDNKDNVHKVDTNENKENTNLNEINEDNINKTNKDNINNTTENTEDTTDIELNNGESDSNIKEVSLLDRIEMKLPKTGQVIGAGVIVGLGVVIVAAGVALIRRKKGED